MAPTNRIRIDGLLAPTGPPGLAAAITTPTGTGITFPGALKHSGAVAVPTITDPDYLPLTIDPDSSALETVWLTAYTAGGTTGTILRAQEGTTGATHPTGAQVVHGPNAADLNGAVPAAKAFVTKSMPDTAGSGDMTVLMFPADDAALAIGLVGDAYPRWLLTTDAGDGLYMGDGTFDPYAGGGVNIYGGSSGNLYIAAGGYITLSPANGVFVYADLQIQSNAQGVILVSPDSTKHRIKVANDGTLSTEVVP